MVLRQGISCLPAPAKSPNSTISQLKGPNPGSQKMLYNEALTGFVRLCVCNDPHLECKRGIPEKQELLQMSQLFGRQKGTE